RCRPAIRCISIAGVTEVVRYSVELPPGDCHLTAVCGVNGERALVRSVAEDVVPICIDVYLKARKRIELRDHSRRSLYLSRRRRRIIVPFKWLISGRLARRCQLGCSAGQRNEPLETHEKPPAPPPKIEIGRAHV